MHRIRAAPLQIDDIVLCRPDPRVAGSLLLTASQGNIVARDKP